jgi:hypothetical protein
MARLQEIVEKIDYKGLRLDHLLVKRARRQGRVLQWPI